MSIFLVVLIIVSLASVPATSEDEIIMGPPAESLYPNGGDHDPYLVTPPIPEEKLESESAGRYSRDKNTLHSVHSGGQDPYIDKHGNILNPKQEGGQSVRREQLSAEQEPGPHPGTRNYHDELDPYLDKDGHAQDIRQTGTHRNAGRTVVEDKKDQDKSYSPHSSDGDEKGLHDGGDKCEGIRCSDYAVCYEGICVCDPGFTKDDYGRCLKNKRCEDVNCPEHATCQNGKCKCKDGFTTQGSKCLYEGHGTPLPKPYDPEMNAKCEEVECPIDATCKHGVCECNSGFAEDGYGRCVDGRQSCKAMKCSANALCKMTSGQPGCYCKPMYRMVSRSCVPDSDSVLTKADATAERNPHVSDGKHYDPCFQSRCGLYGSCYAENGVPACICARGYKELSGICVQVSAESDPCSGYNCGQYGVCRIYLGKPVCACVPGYKVVSNACVSVNDPCKLCGQHGYCIPVLGKLRCVCKRGYTLVSGTCTIDPCSTVHCGKYGRCEIQDHTPTCVCATGYAMTGGTCSKTDICRGRQCGEHGHCVNYFGEARCVCTHGSKLIDGICRRADPCSFKRCGEYEECRHVGGLAFCTCASDYERVGGICSKVATCADMECGSNEYCATNTGKPMCTCIPGYQMVAGKCTQSASTTQSTHHSDSNSGFHIQSRTAHRYYVI